LTGIYYYLNFVPCFVNYKPTTTSTVSCPMEDNNMQHNEFDKKEQDSKKVIVIVVISILLGVNGLLLWQFFDKKTHLEEVNMTLESTLSEKESLSAELQRMKVEYEKINQENASLQNQLTAKDEEIKSKMAEIQRLINSGDAAQLRRAKQELASLKTLNQTYIADLDSLKLANEELNAQNSNLNSSLLSERGKVQNLTQENTMLANKVVMGSVLKTINIKASGVKYRSSGKESESNRASSVDKIRTCFTVLENLVVDRGTKDAYLRVLSPDGAVMSTSSETFIYNNQATLYTAKESFEYDNKQTDLCLYWTKGSIYTKGKYIIEIYVDGNLIGSTNLTLK
jgi:flagellar basal body-associated protein FliL